MYVGLLDAKPQFYSESHGEILPNHVFCCRKALCFIMIGSIEMDVFRGVGIPPTGLYTIHKYMTCHWKVSSRQ